MNDTIERDTLVNALQTIFRNDRTRYEHHEPRSWDGQEPIAVGGTIWLTPREIAANLLRRMGAKVPDSFVEMRERQAARARRGTLCTDRACHIAGEHPYHQESALSPSASSPTADPPTAETSATDTGGGADPEGDLPPAGWIP